MRQREVHLSWNFDYLMFIFTRISAVCMFVLGIIGLSVALWQGARQQMDLETLLRWSFFPNPNHVVSSVVDVQAGWQNGFWEIMQILIVFFGITHGINGLRVVLEDTVKGDIIQSLIRIGLLILWLFLFIVAIYVIRAG